MSVRSQAACAATSPFTPLEEVQLIVLFEQAWDLRQSPYLRDALEALEAWWLRLPAQRVARALELHARQRRVRVTELVELLRATNPDVIGCETAA